MVKPHPQCNTTVPLEGADPHIPRENDSGAGLWIQRRVLIVPPVLVQKEALLVIEVTIGLAESAGMWRGIPPSWARGDLGGRARLKLNGQARIKIKEVK